MSTPHLTRHPKDKRGYQVVLVQAPEGQGLKFFPLSTAPTYQEALWDAKAAKAHNDYLGEIRAWVKILEITTSGQIWCEAVYLASAKPLGKPGGDVYVTPKDWE